MQIPQEEKDPGMGGVGGGDMGGDCVLIPKIVCYHYS